MNLPKPLLGNITALTITSPDLQRSLAYYQQLGFCEVLRADWPFAWIQITDGVLLIMLRQDATPYIALTYYVNNIEAIVEILEQKGITLSQKAKKTDMVKRCLFQSPDGLNISLVSMVEGFKQPPGPGMLQMPQQDYFNPEQYVNKTCGLFGELAHPVADLEISLGFWQLLGFSIISKFASPYPWAIISDGLSVVGLHQSGHFDRPAITYFSADMKSKIAALKQSGLQDFIQENDSNIILTTPEQQQIFLFSLGESAASAATKKEIVAPVIETKRLLLKELNPEIMNELFNTCTDAEIIAFLGLPDDAALEVEKRNWQKGLTTYRLSFKNFLVIEKVTGKVIGRCGFHTWYLLHHRAELGYAMANESVMGKGFMKEALRRIIAYGFEQMQLNRVEAYIGRKNAPSLRLVKGAGFTEEGVLRSHYYKNGEAQDSICFSLLRPEYETIKSSWG